MNLNNSVLNAAPYSLNGQAQPKPSYAQSRFGASLGGPLVIPKLVKWQRASFFFSYSGTRSRNPYSEVACPHAGRARRRFFPGAHQRRLHDLRSAQPPTFRQQHYSLFPI
jgi:hypothetical protein